MPLQAAVGEHPVDRLPGVPLQTYGQGAVAGRLVVGVEQDEEERRGVHGTVVPAVRNLPEVGEFAVPGLVDDASGLLAAEDVVALPLGGGERAQDGGRRRGPVRQQEVRRQE